MALTLSERETIVVFNEQHDAAEVFTYNARLYTASTSIIKSYHDTAKK